MVRRRITINVNGVKFQTYRATLRRFPNTLLADLVANDSLCIRFDFDRSKSCTIRSSTQCFNAILYFYQSYGILRCPKDVSINLFANECSYFKLPDEFIQEMKESQGILPQKICSIEAKLGTFKEKVWDILEHPETSFTARIFAFFSLSVILLSIVIASVETVESLHKHEEDYNRWADPYVLIEVSVTSWFLIELIARFIFCPSKSHFLCSLLNWVDFVAVAPYFFTLAISGGNAESLQSLGFLRTLRFVRVIRLIRLSKQSVRIQVMVRVIKSCTTDFQMLIAVLCVFMIFGGSILYFLECTGECVGDECKDEQFSSIPNSFYWAIVTVTTVGYGDIYPVTPLGKVVSSCFMIFGVITLMLPILAIVSKFTCYYEQNVEALSTIS